MKVRILTTVACIAFLVSSVGDSSASLTYVADCDAVTCATEQMSLPPKKEKKDKKNKNKPPRDGKKPIGKAPRPDGTANGDSLMPPPPPPGDFAPGDSLMPPPPPDGEAPKFAPSDSLRVPPPPKPDGKKSKK